MPAYTKLPEITLKIVQNIKSKPRNILIRAIFIQRWTLIEHMQKEKKKKTELFSYNKHVLSEYNKKFFLSTK